MELTIKAAAAALTAAFIGLVLEKRAPEQKLLLSLAACAVILVPVIRLSESFFALIASARTMAELSPELLSPIVKCLAVAVTTKISCALCRDAGQSASSSALELAGTLAAFAAACPLLKELLVLIGSFV